MWRLRWCYSWLGGYGACCCYRTCPCALQPAALHARACVCVCVCACSSSYDRVELWLLVECIPSTAQKSCNLLLHTCVCVCVPAAAATTAWTLTHGIPILAAGVATVVATVPLLMTTPLPAPPPTATTDTETGK